MPMTSQTWFFFFSDMEKLGKIFPKNKNYSNLQKENKKKTPNCIVK